MPDPEPISMDVGKNLQYYTWHYNSYPPPDGRTIRELLEGRPAQHGSEQCLWPACFQSLKGDKKNSYLYPEKSERDIPRFLWSLYHLQEGVVYLKRWMFWREPPKLKRFQKLVPMRYTRHADN